MTVWDAESTAIPTSPSGSFNPHLSWLYQYNIQNVTLNHLNVLKPPPLVDEKCQVDQTTFGLFLLDLLTLWMGPPLGFLLSPVPPLSPTEKKGWRA